MAKAEKNRGCSRLSKLYDITEDVVYRYVELGQSCSAIAEAHKERGITSNMISGYVHRNQLKHKEGVIHGGPNLKRNIPSVRKLNLGTSQEVEKLAPPSEAVKQRREMALAIFRKWKETRTEPPKTPIKEESKSVTENVGCWATVGPDALNGADQLFCGKPRALGSRFCEDHRKTFSYIPPPKKRRLSA